MILEKISWWTVELGLSVPPPGSFAGAHSLEWAEPPDNWQKPWVATSPSSDSCSTPCRGTISRPGWCSGHSPPLDTASTVHHGQAWNVFRVSKSKPYCITMYYRVLYCTVMYYTVLYCTVMYYTILYYVTFSRHNLLINAVLYYNVLYSTVLYIQ